MATTSNNDIAEAIYFAIKESKEPSLVYKKVVDFLVRKRLLSKSKEILARLKKVVNEKEGRMEAKVISKNPLGSDIKKELSEVLIKRYKAKDIYLKECIDEKVVGGFRIEVEDEIIDLSIKNKLKKLQEHLISNK